MSATVPRMSPPAGPIWPAAFAGMAALLVGIGLGRFGYTPLIPVLIEAGWFDAAAADYLGATNLAGYVVGAAIARRLGRKWSSSLLIPAAMLLAAVSFAACALPLGFGWYFGWRLVSGIVGGVLMVLAAPSILPLVPAAKRARASGVIFTGVGAGVALAGTLVPWLAHRGLPLTWLCFAAAAAALSVYAWLALPRAQAAPAAGGAEAPPAASGTRLTGAIMVLIVAYAANAIGFIPHTVFWVDYIVRGLGLGLPAGGLYWTLFGAAAVVGPLLAGALADRIGVRLAFRLTLFAMALAVAAPLASTHPAVLAFSSLGVGATTIGNTALGSVLASAAAGPAHHRQVWGWMTMVYALAYAGAGYGLTFVFAVTGSFTPIFAAGAAILVIGGAIDFLGARRTGKG